MEYKNFFSWLELAYDIEINKELRNTLTEHFGENLNIYTDKDINKQSKKIIQTYKDKYLNYNKDKYYK